jgi:hypothetical protein
MTKLEIEEYEKCSNDPYYFFKKYCIVKKKRKMVERKEIEDSEYDEVYYIYTEYYTTFDKREYYRDIIDKIEKLTFEDGHIIYVIYFYNNYFNMSSDAIDRDEKYLSLLRKEKLEKINGKYTNN